MVLHVNTLSADYWPFDSLMNDSGIDQMVVNHVKNPRRLVSYPRRSVVGLNRIKQ